MQCTSYIIGTIDVYGYGTKATAEQYYPFRYRGGNDGSAAGTRERSGDAGPTTISANRPRPSTANLVFASGPTDSWRHHPADRSPRESDLLAAAFRARRPAAAGRCSSRRRRDSRRGVGIVEGRDGRPRDPTVSTGRGRVGRGRRSSDRRVRAYRCDDVFAWRRRRVFFVTPLPIRFV